MTLLSVGVEEMKKKRAPKSVSFHIEMNLVSGILKINGLNYGTYTMEKRP